MNTLQETVFEMVERVAGRTAPLSLGGLKMKTAWSVSWRLYGNVAVSHRGDQDQEQILARCAESKREHYERVFSDLASAFKAFAAGISGDKDESYCIHLHTVELDHHDVVVSRHELDRRGGFCV